MIELTEEKDFNLKLLENWSTRALEYLENLKTEKDALEQLKRDIISLVNNVITSIFTNINIYESKSELFQNVLNKKKKYLKEKDKFKMNYSGNISEQAKIFKITTEDYLSLINQIENTKVYLNDILAIVTQQVPNDLNLQSQEVIHFSNIPIEISQNDKCSQETIKNFSSQKLQKMLEKKKGKNEEVIENKEVKKSKSIVPSQMNMKNQNEIFQDKFPSIIIKNKNLSKQIRKKFLEGNYEDLLFNPKYEQMWRSIPDKVYLDFAKGIKNFAAENGYKRFNICPYSLERILRNLIRVKYTSINFVDYISPEDEIHTEKIRGALRKSLIKFKFIVNRGNSSNFYKPVKRMKNMFLYYFFKKDDKNTFKFYGEIRSIYRFDNHFFWNEALKTKYDYLSWKSYQHEEDLMRNFDYDAGFQHNLQFSFVEEMGQKIRELDEIRKEYARLVLNYMII